MENKSESTSGAAGHRGCFMCQTARPFFEHVWNDAARNHFRSSRIEFLKGIRSLLDDRIARLSRDEPKGTTIPVE
jgi:hypothetical protein